jgi:putative PIN family toxin of toxin-antitoxin system
MRVVLDTNVLVRAAMSPGGLAGVLQTMLRKPKHELIVSTWLLQELEDVLCRPRLRQYHKFDDSRVRQIVFDLDVIATRTIIGSRPSSAIVPADPKDDPVVLTAIAGEADVICTLDAHLQTPQVRAYCSQHGIRILSDVELIQELRAS